MKPIYSEIIQFRGSHYEFGQEQGRRFKETNLYHHHKSRRGKSLRKYAVDMRDVETFYLRYARNIWEELRGLADSLEWSFEEVVHEYSGWQQDWVKSGCSIFTSSDFFARNYDYHPKTYEGRFILFQPDIGFATIGPGQRIIGRTDGMNEHGLCIGYNFVNRIKPEDGLICCHLTRIVLENCRTTKEAVALLQELPHRHAFNYVIYDQQQMTRVVEGTPRGVYVREGNVCTNHFDYHKHENRRHLGDSKERFDKIEQQVPSIRTVFDAYQFLNHTEHSIFSKRYRQWSGTIHTACYENRNLHLLFGLGGDTNPVVIDFKKWLAGQQTNLKKVIGRLDTDLSIPYID
ncbi:linear amide C-N hydrolase [Halobacillus fulvus]|nr:linear amide C-N hydrolase [Halobacillus fulvus]